MAKPTIAIIGGKGMLGTDLADLCTARKLPFTIHDLPDFDITDAGSLEQVVKNAAVIVNCAAYTNVDKAESEQELAFQINAEAVGQLAWIAAKYDKYLMHISTDFVFDGKLDRPYIETDPPNPLSIYGQTKLAGEQLLLESDCNCCIIRVQWTFGQAGNNFVTKLLERAKQTNAVKVVDDQIGSPTSTKQVASTILKLLPKRPEGIYHFAADGYTSRYEMAKFIFSNIDPDVEVTSCKTSDFKTAAKRPLNSRFDCTKIKELLDEPIESWQTALTQYLESL